MNRKVTFSMKKILAVLLAICMVFLFTACDTSAGADGNEQGGDVTNVSTDDEVKLNNVIGDGSLTITEKFNSVEVTITHPEITADFLEKGNKVNVHFSTDGTKYSIETHDTVQNEYYSTIYIRDKDEHFDITHIVQDGKYVFTWVNAPFDLTNEASVFVQIGDDATGEESVVDRIYSATFEMEDVLIPYAGATLLEGGSPQSEDEIVLDNVIGDVSLTVKEQYDSYHVTITHPSYMAEFLEGQNVHFSVYLEQDGSESNHILGLSYNSNQPGQIMPNYVYYAGVGSSGQSKPLTYTIDENALTWYLPKSYGLNMDSFVSFSPYIINATVDPNGEGYRESFLKSNCYIPYDDSTISATNSEELTIFDGHWTRPDGYVTTSVQSIDSFMVDSESGTWAEYNEFAFYGDSLSCYANDGNLTMLLSLAGELILTEQNGNLVDSEGDVQYVKAEAPNRDDIVNELLGNWVLNPDMGFTTLIFSENGELQQLSRSGEVAYTGTWSLVEMEFTHEDEGAIVDTPFIKIDIGDDTVKGYYSILGSKALSRGTMFYFIHEDAMEDTFTRNIVNLTAQQWRCEYEDDIGTHRATLRFEDKIDRRVTLLIESHLKASDTRPYVFTIEGTWEFVQDDVLRITFSDGTYEDIPFDGTSLDIEHYGLTFE